MNLDTDQAAGLRARAEEHKALRIPPRLRCVAVSSGKGGVGKTMIAVGLGCCLARMNHRVLILDADLDLANVDIQMGLDPEFTLQDAVLGNCSLADVVTTMKNGPDVLASSSGAPGMVDMGNARREMFIRELIRFAAGYEYLIIDVAAGIGRNVMAFLSASPEVLIVVANEPTSVMDAYSVIKELCRSEDPPAIMMVVNMVRSPDEGELLANRLNGIARKFLGVTFPVAGVVVFDHMVGNAIRARCPVPTYAAKSPTSQCLEELAEYLVSRQARERARNSPDKNFFDELAGMGITHET